ncbi:hypothetical protein GCM10010954_17970 [Halobacillus andaensis]|uniref:Cytochrome c oxidase subunit 2A n=1 Tax=Halobacillus andaensis TaxID=1176239 RepID=A0A917EVA0_HALAA|nr:cytochrome C oxidase subunit II [Halobacillus andaensis]MBP2004702.1 hypothetical protein [Halobacillus andaensis]GGF19636.1 hypothetical protein GCM10010954_17970 [Halobacillus andaensis]
MMKKDNEPNLKGTFLSVMLIGGVIIVMWVSIFVLYMTRV